MFNFINNKLPPDLSNMFQYSFTVHNYNTRNVSNQGLYIPSINTTAFGNKSLRYNTPVVWNKLLKTNPEISNSVSMNSLKYTLKSYYLKTYSALLLINNLYFNINMIFFLSYIITLFSSYTYSSAHYFNFLFSLSYMIYTIFEIYYYIPYTSYEFYSNSLYRDLFCLNKQNSV